MIMKGPKIIKIILSTGLVLSLLSPPSGAQDDKPSAFIEKTERGLNEMGFAFLKEKNYSEAEKYFHLAIAENPAVKFYYNNLAVACMNMGRYRDAYRPLQIAISMDPRYVKALSNMAVTCFHLFKFQEAFSCYIRAKRVDREYAHQRFELSRVVERMEQIKKENPDNREIDQMLKYLKDNKNILE